MPTHGSHCEWCGQHRQAEAELNEALIVLETCKQLLFAAIPDFGDAFPATVARVNEQLARLDERYPRE